MLTATPPLEFVVINTPSLSIALSCAEQLAPIPTDEALLGAIAVGSESAVEVLFNRYSKLIFSVALRVTHSPHYAEDIMQEVFMKIWRSSESFVNIKGSMAGWLTVTVRNRAIDFLRSRHHTERIDNYLVTSSIDVANQAEQELLCSRARLVIRRLPFEQRQALELAFFEGFTHTEIAEIMTMPLGTVKTRIRSGLITLRKAFMRSSTA